MKKFILPLVVFFVSLSAMAQSKVGTIDSDLVIASLDEVAQVQKDLEAYGADLDRQFKELVTKYQNAVKAYQDAEATATEEDKGKKQEEIVEMEQDIQRFRQNSQGLIQIKQNELMQPLYQKVGQALDAVAREQNYTQVLTLNAGVAYFDPALDITDDVAKKLGVTLKAGEENGGQ
ncbi:OmpH family outer membrane protein [Leeuwenhoekiella parthenopeia]|uniref:OmpH family outer membrane protein n=1 Tax=Leeuwenhoekiella parthenopeia TaxID=2890320 RepID=A0ABS8GUB6_9FLAO|nr:OmpH family outer membrane protein [Leeuwenhoekiella parthenopeia]MCC4213386.1 OmpH family outer membrane protein [Leeuwenhoekiella parthenopeia]